jgi:hypothetical protein
VTKAKRLRLTTRAPVQDFGWLDPSLPKVLEGHLQRLPEDRRALARKDFGEIVAQYRIDRDGLDTTKPGERAEDAEALAAAALFLADRLGRVHPDAKAHADADLLRLGRPMLAALARELRGPLLDVAEALTTAGEKVRNRNPGRPSAKHEEQMKDGLERACKAHRLGPHVAVEAAEALRAERVKR